MFFKSGTTAVFTAPCFTMPMGCLATALADPIREIRGQFAAGRRSRGRGGEGEKGEKEKQE